MWAAAMLHTKPYLRPTGAPALPAAITEVAYGWRHGPRYFRDHTMIPSWREYLIVRAGEQTVIGMV